jgi:hypothetical protein
VHEALEELAMDLVGNPTARRIFEARPFPFSELVVKGAHTFAVVHCHWVTLLNEHELGSTIRQLD